MPTVLESLNSALHRAFADDERVYLLGEDILDPYGGAFKVSRGLSTRYPNRVLSTPISEAGFTGVATGMALRGLRPVVEIMFGDFISLIADQLINQITKFRWMYNNQVKLPLVIRTPMGGRRGYGPTHSQTLEKLFLGVPGLQVVAPVALCLENETGSPGELLYRSILQNDEPALFVENKLQYLSTVQKPSQLKEFYLVTQQAADGINFPTYTINIKGAPQTNLTIASYGYMAELTMQAAIKLAYEHEIFIEAVFPTRLTPYEGEAITSSTQRTGALLVAEEGALTSGWGAEVISRTVQSLGSKAIKYSRLASKDLPVPASAPLEAQVIPGVQQIVQAAIQMFR